jgi:hypothetical protein
MKSLMPELISALISEIYDCAIEPAGWNATALPM